MALGDQMPFTSWLFLCVCGGGWILVPQQRRQWHPTPVLLPGKSHGQRSLESYSSWDHKESDMTEQLSFAVVVVQSPSRVQLFNTHKQIQVPNRKPLYPQHILCSWEPWGLTCTLESACRILIPRPFLQSGDFSSTVWELVPSRYDQRILLVCNGGYFTGSSSQGCDQVREMYMTQRRPELRSELHRFHWYTTQSKQ